MSRGSPTHVIEVEAGVGEPASTPLTLGQELEPVSIGRAATWRVEADGVLDVHAFVYYDGASLFLRAEDGAVVVVEGAPIATTWTEIHAPCTISLGAARLRFRSAAENRTTRATPASLAPAEGVSSSRRGPASSRRNEDGRRERPFRPGEFASAPAQGESTRVKPLDGSASRPPPTPNAPVPPRTSVLPRSARPPSQPDPPVVPMPPMTMPLQSAPEGVPHGTLAIPDMPLAPGPGELPMTAPIPVPFPSGYPGAPPSAPQTGGYGVITGSARRPSTSLLARFKELTPPQRALVILAPFSLVSAAYLLLFDEPQPTARTAADASTDVVVATPVAVTAPPAVTTAPPPSAAAPVLACPPGFVLYNVPINGQLTCVPSGTPMAAQPDAGLAVYDPSRTAAVPAPAPAPAPTLRTLERQAVDLVATGNYLGAAQAYEVLLQQNPTNRVYAEAARILRAKADAGAP